MSPTPMHSPDMALIYVPLLAAEVSCLCHPPPGDEDLVLLVLVLRKIYPLLRWFHVSASGLKN